MTDDDADEQSDEGPSLNRRSTPFAASRFADVTNRFVYAVELVAAAVFALLFAIGVADLLLQIIAAVRGGSITDPLVVIGFIDTGLLLLIIVEVYETVIAYTEESETRRIVRLVIYTGVIAMVRKTIIFRTGEYASAQDALFAAVAYTILIFGLVGLLLVERGYGARLGE
ncbi:phosphate-starvation-inducible PsiE family protein [Haloplanus halobius]|uniref:phosphate-starvation-inducible PsiE family protein n=1 Tax=Haloplanus halobius TaxID=2934938 RepID=UPI00200DD7CF|nr:phosphate-starvation-inducible PsiE family protein [Haloplanus sp. XH21]